MVLDRVLARPGVSAVLSAGFLLAIASSAVGLHTENLSVDKILPSSTPIVQSYDHIMAAFPGGPAPALVVVKAPDIRSAGARQAIAALAVLAATEAAAADARPSRTEYPASRTRARASRSRLACSGGGG